MNTLNFPHLNYRIFFTFIREQYIDIVLVGLKCKDPKKILMGSEVSCMEEYVNHKLEIRIQGGTNIGLQWFM